MGALQPREATRAIRFCRQTRRRRRSAKSGIQCRSGDLHSWPRAARSVHLSGRSRARKRHREHRHTHGVAARPAEFVGDDSYSGAISEPCRCLSHRQPRPGRTFDARRDGGRPAAKLGALSAQALSNGSPLASGAVYSAHWLNICSGHNRPPHAELGSSPIWSSFK